MKKEILIPYLDLGRINKPFHDEFINSLKKVLASNRYILGNEVRNFELKFAKRCNTNYAVGVGNGLDAITISLKALGIKAGDEVIVPSNTYIATWIAVTRLGASILPIEPRKDTYNINPELIQEKISKKTKAIIPVHLYGQPCEMKSIMEIASKNNLFVVEDAAQAHFAKYNSQLIGSIGHLTAFSFYPGKNLGALGDGGAITTNNKILFEKILSIRNYGSNKKYHNKYDGLNSRLDEIQASFLNLKVEQAISEIEIRKELSKIYFARLCKVPYLKLPTIIPSNITSWHIFPILLKKRDLIKDFLDQKGIQTIIHYPIPPHLQPAYKHLGYKKGDFPISEEIHENILSLPLNSSLKKDDIHYISDCIIEASKFF